MPYVIVANADAGSSGQVEASAAVLSEADGCEIVWTETPGDIDTVIAADDRTLVVAGGDGSIHLLVERLARAGRLDRPVGILPMGTGNDLARGLGLPLDPEAAARRLVEGRPRPLPLMRARDVELAVNNAHAGLGVEAARRGSDWKDRLGALAYPTGSVIEGLRFEGFESTVEADGRLFHRGRGLLVMVLVGPSAGGGFRPLPDVDIEERALDLLVVEADGLPERVAVALAALRGELTEHEAVRHTRARQIRVESGGEEWELDGEFRRWEEPVGFALAEDSWSVIA